METEFWQRDIELMSRADLEAFQLGCLKKTLKLAAHSPFYSNILTESVIDSIRTLDDIRRLCALPEDEVANYAKEIGAPLEICLLVRKEGRLPVVNFAAGGIATPADAALMMQLGCDGVFVGSGIFKSGDPARRARAIVQAVTNYNDYKLLAEISKDLGEPMVGIEISSIPSAERMQERGW